MWNLLMRISSDVFFRYIVSCPDVKIFTVLSLCWLITSKKVVVHRIHRRATEPCEIQFYVKLFEISDLRQTERTILWKPHKSLWLDMHAHFFKSNGWYIYIWFLFLNLYKAFYVIKCNRWFDVSHRFDSKENQPQSVNQLHCHGFLF